ncbi:MAG: ABC transporter ATP-binding protein [Defluviitaleaceae bacterium]|nr:ABC transporter ATP-binding protein [Defluviitaleaceae bacterium]
MITLDGICKSFKDEHVLKDISFTVNNGEFVSIVGESGTGKSTLLGIILGSVLPEKGTVFLNGRDITSEVIAKRKIGIVFQQCALFPTMSVLDNVIYPLRKNNHTKTDAHEKAMKYLNLTGLFGDHLKKKPYMLSGGQSQRVAIARMLAMEYPVLLLDEPFSALDPNIRMQLRDEIYDIQRKLNITVLYVTHDIEEAVSLSDKLMILHNKVVQQYDAPSKVITHPANTYVSSYIRDNLLKKLEILERLTNNEHKTD